MISRILSHTNTFIYTRLNDFKYGSLTLVNLFMEYLYVIQYELFVCTQIKCFKFYHLILRILSINSCDGPVKGLEERHELRITWIKYIEWKYKYSIGKRVLNINLTAKVLGCEQFGTSPGGNTQQSTSCTATYLPLRKLSKLDELDMQDTAEEAGMSS